MNLTLRKTLRLAGLAGIFCSIVHSLPATGLDTQFEERMRSVVVVEFFVENEENRRSYSVNGIVIDGRGLIQLSDSAVPSWVPLDRLKDFTVYIPGSPDEYSAAYLGNDRVYGWNFIRAEEVLWDQLRPISEYPLGEPKIGQRVWGIGIAAKNLDYLGYFMRGEVSAIQALPQLIGFATFEVASPGALVFNDAGELIGWGSGPLSIEHQMTIEGKRYKAFLKKPDQTSTFVVDRAVIDGFGAVPASPEINDRPWLGMIGLEPLNDEVAEHMELENASAISISEIFDGGPADLAGLKESDIVVKLEGKAFRRYVARQAVVSHFEKEILKHSVGDEVTLSVLSGGVTKDVAVVLGPHPKLHRDAERKYFKKLGLTVREFIVSDSITLRLQFDADKLPGVMVNYVKSNSFAHEGGLKHGDLIKEIDGQVVASLEQSIELIESLMDDEERKDFVILVKRGAETSVLRINIR